ncbi:MAG: hypothetical protein KJ587_12770 [Alphaproteobacteria bacterium]|nr:hypothetical protein [Alphaproteobacteria bacterium]
MPPPADQPIRPNDNDAARAVTYMAVKVAVKVAVFVLLPLVMALATAFLVLR